MPYPANCTEANVAASASALRNVMHMVLDGQVIGKRFSAAKWQLLAQLCHIPLSTRYGTRTSFLGTDLHAMVCFDLLWALQSIHRVAATPCSCFPQDAGTRHSPLSPAGCPTCYLRKGDRQAREWTVRLPVQRCGGQEGVSLYCADDCTLPCVCTKKGGCLCQSCDHPRLARLVLCDARKTPSATLGDPLFFLGGLWWHQLRALWRDTSGWGVRLIANLTAPGPVLTASVHGIVLLLWFERHATKRQLRRFDAGEDDRRIDAFTALPMKGVYPVARVPCPIQSDHAHNTVDDKRKPRRIPKSGVLVVIPQDVRKSSGQTEPSCGKIAK